MSTSEEKTQCVSWFIETKSVIQTRGNYTATIDSSIKDDLERNRISLSCPFCNEQRPDWYLLTISL